MKAIFALSLAGAVVALGVQQNPTPPVVQRPQPQVPTVQAPKVTPPAAQQTAPQAPTVQAPQTTPPVAQPALPAAQATGQSFEATWSATGQRQTLAIEGGRKAVAVKLSGTVMLTTASGLSRGFRGEVLGFDDGAGLIAGRVVWTDDKGDQLFSALHGDALVSTSRQMYGTITGGTGRYAGLTGEYQFRWQSLVATDDETVAGRVTDLRGRVRTAGGLR